MPGSANSVAKRVQLPLPLFTAHEVAAWQQDEERKLAHQAARRPRGFVTFRLTDDGRSRLLFAELTPQELSDPINGVFDPNNELNCDLDPLESPEEEVGSDESPELWSDSAVAQLHEAVLHHSLRALQARGNGVEKGEILKWIFVPDRLAARSGQANEVFVPQVFVPFSFERCCRICGYSPDRMRDELIPILSRMGLG